MYIKCVNQEFVLIKNTYKGKKYAIQYGGCGCFQYKNKGVIVRRQKSNSQYFNSNFWYKRSSWLDDIGLIAFFKSKEQEKRFLDLSNFQKILDNPNVKYKSDVLSKTKILLESAKDADLVLEYILNLVSKKIVTIREYNPNYQNPNKPLVVKFGSNWNEALIPVVVNGKPDYILTWRNCD